MSTSFPTTLDAAPGAGRAAWWRLLRPSLFDVIVVVMPLWFFALSGDVASALLSDGDTGWHIRAGDWMVAHRQVLHADPFSFSKAGQPWFAWEWLSDVVYSLLHSAWGLKGLVLLTIVLSSLYLALLFRQMVARGANLFVAFPLALLGFGAASVHLLARPHVWTMVLLAGAAWLIDEDLRRPTRWIWTLAPLTVLWTNLHGGWLSLVAVLGVVAAAKGGEALLGVAEWRTARRYAVLAGVCLAASLANPYGWHLHQHVWTYLNESWVKELTNEFKSPSFRTENMTMFELLLLAAFVAAGWRLRRKELVGPALILFWGHECLVSARHIPLFLTLALPVVAEELGRLWTDWTERAGRKSVAGILGRMARDAQPAIARASVWVAVPFLAAPWAPLVWPRNLAAESFPIAMVERHRAELARSRVFTSDQWGDYLIYRSYPEQRVFIDGRGDFYGEELARDYVGLLNAPYNWRALTAKYRFDGFLLDRKSPLVSVLRLAPEWREADADAQAVLFLPRK